MKPEVIDVILDWEDRLEQYQIDDLVAGTVAVIQALGSGRGSVITLGTPNCDHCQQAGDWAVARREWLLWSQLADRGIPVTYGDYALYPPIDPVQAQPRYGHLRYSYGDTCCVHRRDAPRGLGEAFQRCCQHLIGTDHYSGAEFSPADASLARIAAGDKEIKAGSAAKWREHSLGHHLAMVAAQLAGSPQELPPAGTG